MGILIVGLIFNLIKSLLVAISVLMIYSLLMLSIEAKSFDICVMRMVGQNKIGIVVMVVCQSFVYVFPSLLTAFAACIVVLDKLKNFFENTYGVTIDRYPTLESSMVAIFVGSVIPLLSSVIPVQAALSRNLTDGLDL